MQNYFDILITGGFGFMGSNFIRYLLKNYDDLKILNIDKLGYGANPDNLKEFENDSRIKNIVGDISDKTFLEKIFKNYDFKTIFNFAAETHVDRSISNAEEFVKSNFLGVYNFLEILKESREILFFHISTDEVYGEGKENQKFDENSPLKPSSPYSATKGSADLLIMAYVKTYNIKACIIRPSNNFGPYQFPEKFIPKSIIKIILNQKIPIYGNGKQKREWTYIEDFCKALDLLRQTKNLDIIYNISSEWEIENIEIAKKIIKTLKGENWEEWIEFVEDRPGHDKKYGMNCFKFKKQFKWKPSGDFEKALEKTVKWYKDNRKWWEEILKKYVNLLYETPWKLKW